MSEYSVHYWQGQFIVWWPKFVLSLLDNCLSNQIFLFLANLRIVVLYTVCLRDAVRWINQLHAHPRSLRQWNVSSHCHQSIVRSRMRREHEMILALLHKHRVETLTVSLKARSSCWCPNFWRRLEQFSQNLLAQADWSGGLIGWEVILPSLISRICDAPRIGLLFVFMESSELQNTSVGIKTLGQRSWAGKRAERLWKAILPAQDFSYFSNLQLEKKLNLSSSPITYHFISLDFPLNIFQSCFPLRPTFATPKYPQFVPPL